MMEFFEYMKICMNNNDNIFNEHEHTYRLNKEGP